ncbi:MAG TPA: hypothetical protein VHB72_04745 [Candidatus Saccharimonadales bacterium]|nr:hypothetical protein [Candidatus Saccharimonadales bacterium]
MILAFIIIIGQQLVPLLLAVWCALFITNRSKDAGSTKWRLALWIIVFYIIFWMLLVFAARLLFAQLWGGSD